MENKLEKKLNFLTAYAIISTVIFSSFILISFQVDDNSETFDEITVKRINLISENGDLRMVLSNATRQHPGRINGIELEKRDRPSGILFFNDEGDECGGLIYYGETDEGKTSSGMSFTMDQYKEDQVIQILNAETYTEGKSRIERGISISDLPTGSDLLTRMKKIDEIKEELKTMSEEEQKALINEVGNSLGSKRRLFIGRTPSNASGLYLSGPNGKQKLKIYVDANNKAKIEVLDDSGNAINILEEE